MKARNQGAARGVGEGGEGPVESRVLILNHVVKYRSEPPKSQI